MPDRDLALDAKLSLALGWKLWEERPLTNRETVQAFRADTPATHAWYERYVPAEELDWQKLDASTIPALSTDPAQVVGRMAERFYDLSVLSSGWCYYVHFSKRTPPGAKGSAEDCHFALAIAKAALSALEAEREMAGNREEPARESTIGHRDEG